MSGRVLMTADAVGGVWTYAIDLASGLRSLGVEPTVAVMGPSATAEQQRAALRAGVQLVDTGLPLDWLAEEPAAILAAGEAIRELGRQVGADLIHLNSPALAAAGGFAMPVVGACHSCLATWWAAVKDGPMPEDFGWRTRILWQGLGACDALLAPSAAFAAATARTYEAPAPFVVHNGRAALDVQADRFEGMIFTSGRLWDEGKNIGVLDAAAGLSGASLYAAGPLRGPNGASAPPLRNLQALGSLDQTAVRSWLGRASIYASTALYEPFGLGVLEAAQAGCALVLSDIPTFRELWDGAAVFADPRRPETFAAAFENLRFHPDAARQLGARAQARAQTFTVERMCRGVAEIYDCVLAARPTTRVREVAA